MLSAGADTCHLTGADTCHLTGADTRHLAGADTLPQPHRGSEAGQHPPCAVLDLELRHHAAVSHPRLHGDHHLLGDGEVGVGLNRTFDVGVSAGLGVDFSRHADLLLARHAAHPLDLDGAVDVRDEAVDAAVVLVVEGNCETSGAAWEEQTRPTCTPWPVHLHTDQLQQLLCVAARSEARHSVDADGGQGTSGGEDYQERGQCVNFHDGCDSS